jgi:CRISPR-associated protein Csm1
MSSHQMNANKIALVFYQEILSTLEIDLQVTPKFTPISNPIVNRAKELVNWNHEQTIAPLRSIFDAVNLNPHKSSQQTHYTPPQSIADTNPPIPYPVPAIPDLTAYRAEVKDAIESITSDDWQNLSFLSLFLEKYGSCLSFGDADIALNDFARSTAGVAAALAQAQIAGLDLESTQLRLIAGDLSGIQKFIYTINSDGALKSLRARSFFLELVMIEITHRLIESLQLTQANIIYAGGGNIYILAAATADGLEIIQQVRESINDWFIREYQGEIFLALDSIDFPQADIGNSEFTKHWDRVIQNLAIQKGRKFCNRGQLEKMLSVKASHEPICKVCHRDDEAKLDLLKSGSSVMACGTCRRMFRLGSQIFRTKLVVRSRRMGLSDKFIKIGSGKHEVCYYLFGDDRSIDTDLDRYIIDAKTDPVWLINNWHLEHYRSPNTRSLLLGNYGQHGENETDLDEEEEKQGGRFITAEELATKAAGIDRVGYLRMDVDNLGQIFAKGLGKAHNLPRLAGLSRQMSYFFKVYLNSLAENRQANTDPIEGFTRLTNAARPDLLFIYAGGDDLFISGAWNQIAEFACDIYQSFRAYTGNNHDITISGGISINTSKYPLYRAADEAGDAEGRAKDNDRDSFNLFGETFKWSHWLGRGEEEAGYFNDKNLLKTNIIELTAKLNNPDQIGYSRAFIRNLLILADIRDRKIESLKEHPSSDTKQDLTYYLHLPKLAYALSRLPASVRNNPNFQPVQQDLLNPRSSPYFRAIATWVELLNRK